MIKINKKCNEVKIATEISCLTDRASTGGGYEAAVTDRAVFGLALRCSTM